MADRSEPEWKQSAKLCTFHDRTIFSVDWSRQGNYLVTGAGDDAIRIFEEGSYNDFTLVHQQVKAHANDVNCVRWSPECIKGVDNSQSLLLASAGDDAYIRIWKFFKQ